MQKIVPDDAVLIPDNAQRVFEGVLHDVYQWKQELFDGRQVAFEMLHRQDTALVIGIDGDKAVIVTDTQPHRGSLVGFAGGRVDHDDSSTLAAAQREMKEETGLEFANWRLITVVQPARKMEYFIYAYVAWEITMRAEPTGGDGGEQIEVDYVDYDDLIAKTAPHELPEAIDLLTRAGSIDAITKLPEFKGKLVDRPTKIERSSLG